MWRKLKPIVVLVLCGTAFVGILWAVANYEVWLEQKHGIYLDVLDQYDDDDDDDDDWWD